jgi:hypothetical protein
MAKRTPRNPTPALEAKVALAALKGDKALAELAPFSDVHPNQIITRKTQLLDGAGGMLGATLCLTGHLSYWISIFNSSNLRDLAGAFPTKNPRGCCTRVVHNRRQAVEHTVRPKPSGNSRLGPSQRSPSRSRRTPGLIVRVTVFYLRLRVPRALEGSVGRTIASA